MLSQILLTIRVSLASWPSCWRYPGPLHREVWLSKQRGRNPLSLGLSSLLLALTSLPCQEAHLPFVFPPFFLLPPLGECSVRKWYGQLIHINVLMTDKTSRITTSKEGALNCGLALRPKKKNRPLMVEFQGIAIKLKPLWSHTRWSKTGPAAGDVTIIAPSNVRAKSLLKVCSPER